MMTNDHLNILVIQADQLAAGMLGAYHNPIASTPHIDSLANMGTVFESAYTNFPLCAPSRFSMMSGQLASTIEAFDNGAEFPSSIPTFAHCLRGKKVYNEWAYGNNLGLQSADREESD